MIDLIVILAIHWFADFCMQTHKQAMGKSSNSWLLAEHILSYGLTMGVLLLFYSAWSDHWFFIQKIPAFIIITMLAHFITDYFTSRITKKLWERKKIHSFFMVIGIDQFLHQAQLLLTFYWLMDGYIRK